MSANQGVMRIGEVHAQLRKDFPDVELSKIRYYEDKGLVQPSRSRKGYRLYSERDVACLREAIRLAQEEFVPLRVVRLRLIEQGLLAAPNVTPNARHVARDAAPAVVSAPAPAPAALPPRPVLSVVEASARDDVGAPVKEYFTTNELLATTGLRPEEFNQIQALGLVSPIVVRRRDDVQRTRRASGGALEGVAGSRCRTSILGFAAANCRARNRRRWTT